MPPQALGVRKEGRLDRERRTVRAMLQLYCRGHHETLDGLCAPCEELGQYADARLEHCPYGETKPTCATCPIHCYRPGRRQEMKEVMRYAGPRMLLRHPVLALRHRMDGMAAPPARPGKTSRDV
jgi:hypothetical protein